MLKQTFKYLVLESSLYKVQILKCKMFSFAGGCVFTRRLNYSAMGYFCNVASVVLAM